ncbi:nitrogen fixation protein NifZ [Roseospira navarrensis]|uniref:Nitrogen fixation protein NifZ n=1 Tax=Roseospira navarrensis TaxID=140058 RepID=A0A7X2D4Y1_9PROT|nr:nitrogen fixation protein NifZ [Roseospira navarrensis]MQX38316.1 nitrogen fixation protein NifZ [Roseospira navarrensis]
MNETATDEALEIDRPPAFALGTKVRATALIRNDGTFPGAPVGEVLVRPGDVGYVRDVGSFLQRFRIYAVDFIGLNRIVGLRAGELESAEATPAAEVPA